MKGLFRDFTKIEWVLYLSSLCAILFSFFLFDGTNYLGLICSCVGATSLIFCSKGHPMGQFLIIIFALFYGYISYTFSYFGEMITYLGMTAPMAVLALISWLRHPYKNDKSQVEVNYIGYRETLFMLLLSVVVTVIFYFILKWLGTATLIVSTVSVITSFTACYLTFRRSPYYALAYALNDLVLIVLWAVATLENMGYLSTLICFVVFLINDIYGYINWKKMYIKQNR